MVLAAHQLVGLADPDDLADSRHRPQVEALEGRDVGPEQDVERLVSRAVEELARQSGGHLEVSSSEGEGTRVELEVPSR